MQPSQKTNAPKLVFGSSLDYQERRKRLRLLPPSPPVGLNPFHAPTVNALEGMFERVMAIANASNKPSSSSSSKWHPNSQHRFLVDHNKPEERDTIASWPADPLVISSVKKSSHTHKGCERPQMPSVWSTLSEPTSSTEPSQNGYRYMLPPSNVSSAMEAAQKPQEHPSVFAQPPQKWASVHQEFTESTTQPPRVASTNVPEITRPLKRDRSPAPADDGAESEASVVELLSSDDENISEVSEVEEEEEEEEEDDGIEEIAIQEEYEEYEEYEDEYDQAEEDALEDERKELHPGFAVEHEDFKNYRPQMDRGYQQLTGVMTLDDSEDEQTAYDNLQDYNEAEAESGEQSQSWRRTTDSMRSHGFDTNIQQPAEAEPGEQIHLWHRSMDSTRLQGFDTNIQQPFNYGVSELDHSQEDGYSVEEDVEEGYSEGDVGEEQEQPQTYASDTETRAFTPASESSQIDREKSPSHASSELPSDDVVLLLDSDNEEPEENELLSNDGQDEIEDEEWAEEEEEEEEEDDDDEEEEEEEEEENADEGAHHLQDEDEGRNGVVGLDSDHLESRLEREALVAEEKYNENEDFIEGDMQDSIDQAAAFSPLVLSDSAQGLGGSEIMESVEILEHESTPVLAAEEPATDEVVVTLDTLDNTSVDVEVDIIMSDNLAQASGDGQQRDHQTIFEDVHSITDILGDNEMAAVDEQVFSTTYPLVNMDVADPTEQYIARAMPSATQNKDSSTSSMDLEPASTAFDLQVISELSETQVENEPIPQTLREQAFSADFNPEHVSLLERLRAVAQEEKIALVTRDLSPDMDLDKFPILLRRATSVQPITAPDDQNTVQSTSPTKVLDPTTAADNSTSSGTELSSSAPRKARLSRTSTIAQTVRDGKAFIEKIEARSSPNSKSSQSLRSSSNITDAMDDIPSSPTLSVVSVPESNTESVSTTNSSSTRHRSEVRLLVEEARAFCSGIPGPSRTGSNSSSTSAPPAQPVSSPAHRPLTVDTVAPLPAKAQSVGSSPSRGAGYVRRRISFGEGNDPSLISGSEQQALASPASSINSPTASRTRGIGVVDLAAENVIQSTVVGNHALRLFINSTSPVISTGFQTESQANDQEPPAASPGVHSQAQAQTQAHPVTPAFTFGQMPSGITGSGSTRSNSNTNTSVGFSFGTSFVTTPRETSRESSVSPRKGTPFVIEPGIPSSAKSLNPQKNPQDRETIEIAIKSFKKDDKPEGGDEEEEEDHERDDEDEHEDEHHQADSDNDADNDIDNPSLHLVPTQESQDSPITIMVRAPKKKKTPSKTKRKNVKRREATRLQKQRNSNSDKSNAETFADEPSSLE
ncbi:hypothetical protein BGZ79_005352 [Entomortierella chlamydospora]|nr:hypothetical protein BGZ79_005352 [Entomortierella chlamydospora]